MRMLIICFGLVLLAWPFACYQAVSMSSTSSREIDEGKDGGVAGVGPLLRFFIRSRWWVSYAGAAILMLALVL